MIGDKCQTCGRRMNRTPEQNKRYWALLGLIIEKGLFKGLNYDKNQLHDMMKLKFLGARQIKTPEGKVITILNESHDLDTAEFGEYLDQVQVWASEHGVFLDS